MRSEHVTESSCGVVQTSSIRKLSNSNRARRHVGIVTVQPDYSLKGVLRASLVAFNLLGVSLN